MWLDVSWASQHMQLLQNESWQHEYCNPYVHIYCDVLAKVLTLSIFMINMVRRVSSLPISIE